MPDETLKRFEHGYGVGGSYEISMIPNFRKLYPMYADKTDQQILKAFRKKVNAYYDISDDKLAFGLEKKLQPIIEEISARPEEDKEPERRWYNKPITNLPKFMGMVEPAKATKQDINRLLGEGGLNENIKRAIYGGIYGEYESLDELTTPVNLGLLVGTMGLGVAAKKGYHLARLGSSLTSFIFAIMMGKELPAQFEPLADLIKQAKDNPELWGEVGRQGARFLATGIFAGTALKHGFKELRGEIKTLRILKELGERPTKRVTPKQLFDLQKEYFAEQHREAIEFAKEVASGDKFHYKNINEIQQRLKGLMELGKAKVELEKFGKKKTGVDQLDLFWKEEYVPGRQRKIVIEKDKIIEKKPFQEEMFPPPEEQKVYGDKPKLGKKIVEKDISDYYTKTTKDVDVMIEHGYKFADQSVIINESIKNLEKRGFKVDEVLNLKDHIREELSKNELFGDKLGELAEAILEFIPDDRRIYITSGKTGTFGQIHYGNGTINNNLYGPLKNIPGYKGIVSLHEAIHSVTASPFMKADTYGMRYLTKKEYIYVNKIYDLMEDTLPKIFKDRSELNTKLGSIDIEYISDPREFIAHGLSNPEFINILKTTKTKGGVSIWNKFTEILRRLFNLKDKTALNDLANITGEYLYGKEEPFFIKPGMIEQIGEFKSGKRIGGEREIIYPEQKQTPVQMEIFSQGETTRPGLTGKLPTDPTLPLERLPSQTELFRPYEVLSEPTPQLTKQQIKYRNDILSEAGKKGLVDKFGKSSFEMVRLLDIFGVEKIDQLSTQQMRTLRNRLKKLPTDYSAMQIQIGKYYEKINRSVFSPNIARELVDIKNLGEVRIPYDRNYDYIYNPRTAKFEKEKIKISDIDDYNYILKESKQKFGDKATDILNELSDNQLKRFSAEDLKILKNRLNKADPGYTIDELKDFLSNGEPVYSFNEKFIGNKFDWLLSASAQSAYTFFEKVGMGRVFRDAVQNKRLADVTMVNTYKKTIDEIFAPIIKNSRKMKRFTELALEYRERGMAAFEKYPEYKPIMERIKGIFDEVGDLSIEHGVEVFNPITGKNEPFANHRNPFYQPNIYHPKKVAEMRKTNKLNERIKEITGYTDKRKIDQIVEYILTNRKGYRQGNLENVRIVDEPGWLGDPRDSGWKPYDLIDGYMVYLHGAIDRITSLKFFEGKGIGGTDLYGKYINKMGEVNNKIAMEYMNRIRGMNKKGYFDDWAAMIRNVQLMRKLNLAPIANSLQVTITSLPKYSRLGYRRMVIDLAKEAWPIIKTMKHNDLATLGIDVASSMESLVGLQGSNNLNGIARKWLKANLFSTTEFFNRNFSYHLGQRYVERMIRMLHGRDRMFGENFRKWLSGPGRKQLIKELRGMGVSDKAIDTAVLTPEDLHRAGYRFSMDTQFGSMPENLPFAWSSPWGKVATQFKQFTFSNARFVKNNIIKPILNNPGNMNSWKPLLTWIATSQIAGETATYIRQQALKHIFGIERKKPRSTDPMIRGIENMLAISPFGLGWEIWQSLGYGDFWGNVLGPTAGDIEKIAVDYIREGKLPVEEVMPYPLNKTVGQKIRE